VDVSDEAKTASIWASPPQRREHSRRLHGDRWREREHPDMFDQQYPRRLGIISADMRIGQGRGRY